MTSANPLAAAQGEAPPNTQQAEPKVYSVNPSQFVDGLLEVEANYSNGGYDSKPEVKQMLAPAMAEWEKIRAEGNPGNMTKDARRLQIAQRIYPLYKDVVINGSRLEVAFPEANQGSTERQAPTTPGQLATSALKSGWDLVNTSLLENNLWSASKAMEKFLRNEPFLPKYDSKREMDLKNATGAYSDFQKGLLVGGTKAIGQMATPANALIVGLMSRLPQAKALALALPNATQGARALRILNALDAGAHGWFAGGAFQGLIQEFPEMKKAWETGDPMNVGMAAGKMLADTGILGQMGWRSLKAGKAIGTGAPIGVTLEVLESTAGKIQGRGAGPFEPNVFERNLQAGPPAGATAPVYPQPLGMQWGPKVVIEEAVPRLQGLARQARTGAKAVPPPPKPQPAAPPPVEPPPVPPTPEAQSATPAAVAQPAATAPEPASNPPFYPGAMGPQAAEGLQNAYGEYNQLNALGAQRTPQQSARLAELRQMLSQIWTAQRAAAAAPSEPPPQPQAAPVPEPKPQAAPIYQNAEAQAGGLSGAQLQAKIDANRQRIAALSSVGRASGEVKVQLSSLMAETAALERAQVAQTQPPPPPMPEAPAAAAPAPAQPAPGVPAAAAPIITSGSTPGPAAAAAPRSAAPAPAAPAAATAATTAPGVTTGQSAIQKIVKAIGNPGVVNEAFVADLLQEPLEKLLGYRSVLSKPGIGLADEASKLKAKAMDMVIESKQNAINRTRKEQAAAQKQQVKVEKQAAKQEGKPAGKSKLKSAIPDNIVAQLIQKYQGAIKGVSPLSIHITGRLPVEKIVSSAEALKGNEARQVGDWEARLDLNRDIYRILTGKPVSFEPWVRPERPAPVASETPPVAASEAPPPPPPVAAAAAEAPPQPQAKGKGKGRKPKKAEAVSAEAGVAAPAADTAASVVEVRPAAPVAEAPVAEPVAPSEVPVEYAPALLNAYDKLQRVPESEAGGKLYKRLEKRLRNQAEKYRIDLPQFLADQRARQQQESIDLRRAEDRAGAAPAEASEGQGVPTKQPTITPAEPGGPAAKAPPASGVMVRLYRGEATKAGAGVPDWLRESPEYKGIVDATGRWYTNDPAKAEWYLKEAGSGGRVVYIDVPAAEAAKYRVSGIPEARKFSADPESEFFLPKELVNSTKRTQVILGPTPKPASGVESKPLIDHLSTGARDPKYSKAIVAFKKKNPGATPDQLADHLSQKFPGVYTREAYKEFASQFGEQPSPIAATRPAGEEVRPASPAPLQPLSEAEMKALADKLKQEWKTGRPPQTKPIQVTPVPITDPIQLAMRDTATRLGDPAAYEEMAREFYGISYGKKIKSGEHIPNAPAKLEVPMGEALFRMMEQIERNKKTQAMVPARVKSLEVRRQIVQAALDKYAEQNLDLATLFSRKMGEQLAARRAAGVDPFSLRGLELRRNAIQEAVDKANQSAVKPEAPPAPERGAFEEAELPPSVLAAYDKVATATDKKYDKSLKQFDAEASKFGLDPEAAFKEAREFRESERRIQEALKQSKVEEQQKKVTAAETKLARAIAAKAAPKPETPPTPRPGNLVPGVVYVSQVNNKKLGLVKGQQYKYRARVGEAGTPEFEFWPVGEGGKLGKPIQFLNREADLMKALKPVEKPGTFSQFLKDETGTDYITGKVVESVLDKIGEITRGAIKVDKSGKVDIRLPEPLRTLGQIKEAAEMILDMRRQQRQGGEAENPFGMTKDKSWPPSGWIDMSTFNYNTLEYKTGGRLSDKFYNKEAEFEELAWDREAYLWEKIASRFGVSESEARTIKDAIRPAAPSKELINSMPQASLEKLKLEIQADMMQQLGYSRAWDLVHHRANIRGLYRGPEWADTVKGDERTVIAGEIAKSLKASQGFIGRALRDIAATGDLGRLRDIAGQLGPNFFLYAKNFPELMTAVKVMASKAGDKSTLEEMSQSGLSRRDFGKITAGAVGAPLVKMKAKPVIDKVREMVRGQYPGMRIQVEEVPGKEVTYDYYDAKGEHGQQLGRVKTAEEAEALKQNRVKLLINEAEVNERLATALSKRAESARNEDVASNYESVAEKYRQYAANSRALTEKVSVKKLEETLRFESDDAIAWWSREHYEGMERPGSRKDVKLVKVTVPMETPTRMESWDATIAGKRKIIEKSSDEAVLSVTPEEALQKSGLERAVSARQDYDSGEYQLSYSKMDLDAPLTEWLENEWTDRMEGSAVNIFSASDNIWAKRMQTAHDYITQRIEDIKSGKAKPGEPTAPAEVQRTVNTEAPPKQITAPGATPEVKEAPPSAPPKAAAVTGSTAAPKASRRDWFRKLIPGTETPPKVETQAAGKSPFGSERGGFRIGSAPRSNPKSAWLEDGEKWRELEAGDSHTETAEKFFGLADESAAIRKGHVRVSPHGLTALEGIPLDAKVKQLVDKGLIGTGIEHPEIVVERLPKKGRYLVDMTYDIYDPVSGAPIKKGLSAWEYSHFKSSTYARNEAYRGWSESTETPPKRR